MAFLNTASYLSAVLLAVATLPLAGLAAHGMLPPHSSKSQPDLTTLSDRQLAEKLAVAGDVPTIAECDRLRQVTAEIHRREIKNSALAGQAFLTESFCLATQKNYADALVTFKKFWPDVKDVSGVAVYGLTLALETKDSDFASEILRRLASDDPDQLHNIHPSLVKFILREQKAAGRVADRDALIIALADGGYSGGEDDIFVTSIARQAIRIHLRNGDVVRAKPLLGRITVPELLYALLAAIESTAIWSEIEQLVGDSLQTATSNYATNWTSIAAQKPTDRMAFSIAVHALYLSGEFDKAVDLARTYPHTAKGMRALTEDDAWALDTEVKALDALGRHDEASAVFNLLATVPVNKKYPWMVNFVINRAQRLVARGAWQEGLEASIKAHRHAKAFGTPYARMLTLGGQACALHGLGRFAEANALADTIIANRSDGLPTAVNTLLCLGRVDEAAALAIESLNTPDWRWTMVEHLMPRAAFFPDREQIWPSAREILFSRPDVRAAFDKVARVPPERFWPRAASLNRQTKPVQPATTP